MRLSTLFSRYLIKNYLKSFWVVLLITTAMIMLFDCSELLRKASCKPDISFGLVLKMSFLKMPNLIEVISPFIALFAGILCFWQLNKYRELEVAKASGISVWQILSPITLTALSLGAFDLIFINPVASKMMLHYEHLDNYYLNNHTDSLSISESGIWIREVQLGQQNVFHVNRIDQKTKNLSQIVIFQSDDQDRFVRRIDAQEGQFSKNLITLHKVWISLPDQVPALQENLSMPTTLNFRSLQDNGADPASISFWHLLGYVKLLENSGLSPLKYALHWHTLLARWAWLGVMVILAASCTMRPFRQGGFTGMLSLGVVVAFLLYFFRDVAHALGTSSTIPIILAAWIPTGVSALLGVSLLLHLEDG
ncbi:LptF/LptG family permease [Candidatus Nucleicultrix amoebiphila]|uniref:Permease n=1 Tax=Candidatus Nucleicultrix amoebiphila FS5 TaxID=1414854 RepID=A0A1W6N4J2_9PROT|nr:LptF/LptG family permease [Candidatus Nucleicultrix amoebiphila]ARN84742.1 hypothetical protein GQ61_04895 [Candidatus Nucleicultrix amoebiphila FS5]